ncbi:MAG: asparagine synthase (glutamine-hydrolyzing) [Synechococcus sp.]
MCGIAGFIANNISENPSVSLRNMIDAVAHRGPDDSGTFEASISNGTRLLGLGHRRLSIIDLATGHQPLASHDGSIQLVFNGEIYNHIELRERLQKRGYTFATSSDSEAIIYSYLEYGEACVEQFRGMFAFAIWDANREVLFLARDRFGKKPLFLYNRDGNFAFASEIKSLLQFPDLKTNINLQSISQYLSYRYVPGPATLFENIVKLPPGAIATWKQGDVQQCSFYTPPDKQKQIQQQSDSSDDLVGDFLNELEESVQVRMISDVPIGAFLSGGIDSSAVVGLMAKHSQLPVQTFSIGFSESNYSELGYAGVIAQQFKTDHHELVVSQDDLMDLLPAMVESRDAPVSEPSDIPLYLLSKEAEKNVKVVLTGEGSDELLGGYPKHVYERYADRYQLVPRWLRSGLFEPLVESLPYRFRRAKTAALNLGLDDWEERMVRWFGALSKKEAQSLVALQVPQQKAWPTDHFDADLDSTALRRILYFDQTSWLPDNLLERGDRVTMAASIEARTPFLDHHLAAFVSQLPDDYRVRNRTTKWVLRESMKRLLPESILNRPKVGFRVPVNVWFQGPMKDYLYDHLTGANSLTADYYHPAELNKLLDEHVSGRKNHEKLLWTLLNLEVWQRRYFG